MRIDNLNPERDKQVLSVEISKSLEKFNAQIPGSIVMVNFTDTRDIILECILENYLFFSEDKRSLFVAVNINSLAQFQCTNLEVFQSRLIWSHKMLEKLDTHNQNKSIPFKFKSILGIAVNSVIETDNFIGNHAIFRKHVEKLISIAKEKIKVIQEKSLEDSSLCSSLSESG